MKERMRTAPKKKRKEGVSGWHLKTRMTVEKRKIRLTKTEEEEEKDIRL